MEVHRMGWQVLDEVFIVLENRRDSPKPDSYVSSLMKKGLKTVLEKIEEEAMELIEAAKFGETNVIHEAADLIFHTLVLLAYKRVTSTAVPEELRRRRTEASD